MSRADRTRGDAKSVAQQLDVLCGLAVREGVQVVAVFRDDGISASSFAHGAVREGWVQTMEVITSGQVDELWSGCGRSPAPPVTVRFTPRS